MSRFTRYSRISPLELYGELERRAWCAAALAFVFCLSLAGAALCLHAAPLRVGELGQCCFTGVVLSPEPEQRTETSAEVCLPPPLPLAEVEVCAQLPMAPPALLPLQEVLLEWEVPETSAFEFSLFPELPEPPTAAPQRAMAARSARSAERREGELVPAGYRSAPPPPYPASLLSRRVQGRVGLRIEVDAEGVPQVVDVCVPSGYAAFDRSARDWVLAHWRFHPARRNGEAVASVVRTRVDFVLQ